jgi:spore maturation protein SpmB
LEIILEAGRSAVELTLFILLPVMVVMMAVMRALEAKGVLAFVARLLTPVLRPFGVPGIGVFATLQMLFVSYAAPAATLAVMEKQGISRRGLAATLAMILALSQANASFPLLAVGLSLPLTLSPSMIGGLAAAAATYYLFLRTDDEVEATKVAVAEEDRASRFVTLLIKGGEQGVQLSLQAVPSLLLALCALEALAAMGAIPLLERGLSPLLDRLGLPGVAVLPLATKYLAGGTAMLGVVTDLIDKGAMTAADLNRLGGLMINPLDLVGLAVLCPSGTRVAEVARPAILGAVVGILIRGILHLVLG